MTAIILKSLALLSLLNAAPAPTAAEAKDAKARKAHKTEVVAVGRDGGSELTPMDQSNAEPDVQITKRIREAVMADDRLSFNAKNVKIITRGAEVTLKGEVKSTAEHDAVCALAAKTAGVTHVNDELQIKTN